MKKDGNKKNKISRRKVLPFIGGGLLIPFFGSAKAAEKLVELDDDDYEILLTKEGKAVKVKRGTVKDSKVIKKQLSNKSLFNWLKKNDSET